MRARDVQRKRSNEDAQAHVHEDAGDAAYSRFSYVEAVLQYKQALNKTHGARKQRELLRKIASSHLKGMRPERGVGYLESVLDLCLSTEALHSHAPWAMRDIVYHRWMELRTPEALQDLSRAKEMALTIPEATLRAGFLKRINTLTANSLILLGRYTEAATHFSPGRYGMPHAREASISRAIHINQKAIYYATCGRARDAFREFDRACREAKRFPDGYYLMTILDNQILWASALGDFDTARRTCEEALFIARERRVEWRIPYFMLRMADLFIKVRDYERARLLFLDTLGTYVDTPVSRVLHSTIALELAHILRKPDLINRAADEKMLQMVFRSGEPQHIGPLVAARIRIAVAAGDLRCAKNLIKKTIAVTCQADHAADVLALAGRYGSLADAMRAKQLLIERARLPFHRVAFAYLRVWETQMALRRKALNLAENHARKAAHAFARLGLKHQQAQVLEIIGKSLAINEGSAVRQTGASSKFKAILTSRECQVAEFALQGLSNRTIANALRIKEHTVESHMTSILNRLGLRSRWQLMHLFEG